ncbi:nucleotidyltransferase domain-containing protein [Exiguobacterium acetylicum]|uniref:nucleotidyltransferase domain-containing protein n=1 Tax=Exiguobacterium acetylicum TaxID=41170 RepID=UPI001EE15B7D|nr:nucleotidyltransferase domain-containing protein [Exiguobacterium acetylicum]
MKIEWTHDEWQDWIMPLVASRYPDHCAVLLAGSHARGQATAQSDVDLIIFEASRRQAFRESFIHDGMPVEAFIHSFETIQPFFESDRERGRPSLQRMIADSWTIEDHPHLAFIRKEAVQQLADGPIAWTNAEQERARYFLSDVLDDFESVTYRAEGLAIASRLYEQSIEFVLRANRRYIGQGKWAIRALAEFDEDYARRHIVAFELYYQSDDRQEVVALVDDYLAPFGGRYFDGFTLGKR